MPVIREVHADPWCIRLDLAAQVLRLEIEVDDWLVPVPPSVQYGPVSAATLMHKAKQFDDRLYAAVELAAQQGAGHFAGKSALLRQLASALTGDSPGADTIHAACRLGGESAVCPDSLQEPVRKIVQEFLGDERHSKPLGFYTWTEQLRAIFRQDRLLQQPLAAKSADALARALKQTTGATEAYDACLRLNARLSNPADKPDVRNAGNERAFFPASSSHEVKLLELLYGNKPIQDDFDLLSELIRRVRSGKIRLMPTERSGWYDHQTWSLEPLITPERRPESNRLELGRRYRHHMEELFRSCLALARETHAKSMRGGAGGYGGPSPVEVEPTLNVEPLPSVYERRAAGYRFVRSVLEEAFGTDALNKLPRLTPEGESTPGLAEELLWIEELFAGAAEAAYCDLGMADSGGPNTRIFQAWRMALGSDKDVGRDARMMVPVFYDEQRKKTKVWAFLGWRASMLSVAYRVPPTILAVESLRTSDRDPPPVQFGEADYHLASPVMAEVYVERLLDRDEFRQHCDRFKTRDRILGNL